MARALSVTEVLDDAEDVVSRVMSPWGGVLWLSALPLRLLQAHVLDRLAMLGVEATQYGNYLRWLALLATGALLVWLTGRVVFVRACTLSLRSGSSVGAEAMRIGSGPTLNALYMGLLIEVVFLASAAAVVTLPVLALLGGLAAASTPLQRQPGLVAPWRILATTLTHGRALLALTLLFGVAFVLAFVNLYFLYQLGLWLAGGVPGFEPAPWQTLLDLHNRSFRWLVGAGAVLMLEPFWLATLVVFVQKSRAQHSGEDLRIAWERLRAADTR